MLSLLEDSHAHGIDYLADVLIEIGHRCAEAEFLNDCNLVKSVKIQSELAKLRDEVTDKELKVKIQEILDIANGGDSNA